MINLFKTVIATFRSGWYLLIIAAGLSGMVSSCQVSKVNSYFKNIKNDTLLTVPKVQGDEMKIKKGDVLTVTISSLNKEEDQLYSTGADQIGYEVGGTGNIHLHRLGQVMAEGLTRKQLKSKLEQALQPFLKDPLVTVNFANHFITVIGEVGTPHVLQMPKERITIIDALAQSGNASQTSELSRVIVIRDSSETQKFVKHINLEDHSVFNSDYFYLQPNDVVVLNPDEKLIKQQQRAAKYQQVSSIVLQFITTALIIYNTFFRN